MVTGCFQPVTSIYPHFRQHFCLAGDVFSRYHSLMKRFLHSLKQISPAGLWAVRTVLMLCRAVAFAGFVVCLTAGEPGIGSFSAYRVAESLGRAPAGMLLIAGVGIIALEGSR